MVKWQVSNLITNKCIFVSTLKEAKNWLEHTEVGTIHRVDNYGKRDQESVCVVKKVGGVLRTSSDKGF